MQGARSVITADPMQELPLVVESSAASDEATVEEEAIEEEFDLSDIMSEEVEVGSSSKEQKMREVEEQLKVSVLCTEERRYAIGNLNAY